MLPQELDLPSPGGIQTLIHLTGGPKRLTLFYKQITLKINVKKCSKNFVIVAKSIKFKVKLEFSFSFSYFKSKLDNSKLFPKLRLPHGTSERGSAGQIIIDFIISNALAS